MKRILCLMLICCLLALTFTGCRVPNSLTLDLSRGTGDHLKLLHLNAATNANEQRIIAFGSVFAGAEPTEKEITRYGYFPEYLLEIRGASLDAENGFTLNVGSGNIKVYVDLTGSVLEFSFPDGEDRTVYLAKTTAEDFMELINQV